VFGVKSPPKEDVPTVPRGIPDSNPKRFGTVSFILLTPMRPGPPAGGDPVQSFIERELNLSQEQKIRFAESRERFFSKGRGGPAAEAATKRALFDLLKNPSVTDEEVRQRASAIGNMETERSLAIYEHFRDLRAICTPEQQQKFDAFIAEVLMRISSPPGSVSFSFLSTGRNSSYDPPLPGEDVLALSPNRGELERGLIWHYHSN